MKKRIAVSPKIHFGKPCVAGTRIPVQSVLELVREGLSFAEIIQNYYPDLEPDDVRACVWSDHSRPPGNLGRWATHIRGTGDYDARPQV